jgi:hypothetical protein
MSLEKEDIVPAKLVGEVRTRNVMCVFKVSDSKSVGTATSLSQGLSDSVTLWVTIQRTVHRDGAITELVGLSWDKSTEHCWSIVISFRHYFPFHYICSNEH